MVEDGGNLVLSKRLLDVLPLQAGVGRPPHFAVAILDCEGGLGVVKEEEASWRCFELLLLDDRVIGLGGGADSQQRAEPHGFRDYHDGMEGGVGRMGSLRKGVGSEQEASGAVSLMDGSSRSLARIRLRPSASGCSWLTSPGVRARAAQRQETAPVAGVTRNSIQTYSRGHSFKSSTATLLPFRGLHGAPSARPLVWRRHHLSSRQRATMQGLDWKKAFGGAASATRLVARGLCRWAARPVTSQFADIVASVPLSEVSDTL